MKKNYRFINSLLICSLLISMIVSGCSQNQPNQGQPSQSAQPEQTSNAPDSSPTATPASNEKTTPVPEWAYNATMYEVNIRQYTKEGTFKAFEEHLPRLKEMGIRILWFMPIHPISEEKRLEILGSYYSVADYKDVNPEFGTLDDFKALVDKCHEMGFKVMLDWVANHTGWDNAWIDEHEDWYTKDANGNIIIPPTTSWSDVADLNYDNQDMRAEMIEAMSFWVREYDVDGFRCDYATGVPLDFWETAREALEKIKPVFMLAEDDRSMAFMKYAFNTNYGWGLYHNMNKIAKGLYSPNGLISYFESIQSRYPGDTYPLHFIDNHDENSWNGTVEERLGQAQYPMLALIFTTPGMPLIYSGQEANLNRRLLFFQKDEIDWTSLPNEELISTLVKLKLDHPALWNGDIGGSVEFMQTSDKKVLSYERVKDDDRIFVVLNLSSKAIDATITLNQGFSGTNVLTKEDIALSEGDNTIKLEPWEFRIFAK